MNKTLNQKTIRKKSEQILEVNYLTKSSCGASFENFFARRSTLWLEGLLLPPAPHTHLFTNICTNITISQIYEYNKYTKIINIQISQIYKCHKYFDWKLLPAPIALWVKYITNIQLLSPAPLCIRPCLFNTLSCIPNTNICVSLHLYLYLWWIGGGLTINLGLPGGASNLSGTLPCAPWPAHLSATCMENYVQSTLYSVYCTA